MELLRAVYLGGFVVSGVACFAGLPRLSRLSDPDTRRGLAGLLAFTGVWALAHVGRLLPLAPDVQAASYLLGLVVGLATVGAWLYFCSAYSGHGYHRRTAIRQSALAVYVAIVGVKLTNPIHNLYFTTSTTTRPFAHVVIHLGTIHWIVTGLSYALAAIGFFLLYQMLSESNQNVTALVALVAVTGFPVVLYLLSFGDGSLLTLHYEPLGVAAFAVGALYVVDDDFVAVPRFWRNQVIDAVDEVVVLIDGESRVRDANRQAVERFPALADGIGRRLSAVAADLADALASDDDILELDTDGGTRRYYVLNTTSLVSGDVEVGRALICTDVTRVERQRRELRRQNEQFDDLAAAITHELRNTLTVAEGYLRQVAESHPPAHSATEDAYRRIECAHERMDRIVTDLSALARYGRTVETRAKCSLRDVAESAFDDVGPRDASLTVDGDATVVADRARLSELFAKAFEFAAVHGVASVVVRPDRDCIVIVLDGEPLSVAAIDGAFEYADPAPSAETGTLFPTMRTIARAHGWSVRIDPAFEAGVRIVVDDVDVVGPPTEAE